MPVDSRYLKRFSRYPNRFSKLTTLLGVAWLAGVSPSIFAADKPVTYTITDLGLLSGNDTDSKAIAINVNGSITGVSGQYDPSFGFFSETAFLWKPAFPNGTSGSIISLGGLPGYICTDPSSSGTVLLGSDAEDINAANQVAGYSFVGPTDNCLSASQHATIFTTGGDKDLGVPAGYSTSIGLGINTAGHVVGYVQQGGLLGESTLQAFVFDGVFHLLGALPNYPFGQANKINDNGQVAGTSSTTDLSSSRAFLHSGLGPLTGTDDLGTLPGGSNASAAGLNNAGNVVGSSETANSGVYHAYIYRDAKMTDLGTLGDPANSQSAAGSVNDSNDVVGRATVADGSSHAVLWKAAGSILDLNSVLDSGSGWTLTSANGINNSGQIVGSGLVNGHYHAFLLTPSSNLTLALDSEKGCGTQDVAGKLTLANPAGAGGVTVTITSTQPQIADVVGTVKIPEGESSATFKVTTHDVTSDEVVKLQATLDGETASATLTVQALLSKIDTTPDEICSLNSASATVTLACAATSPTTIALSSSDSEVGAVPASVVVPTGQTEANFMVSGGDTQPDVELTLTASFESEKQTTKLTVHPIIGNLAIKSATVPGGKTATGIVTLTAGKACFPPAGGLRINLFSDNTHLAVPAVSSITMPPGANVGNFTIDTFVPTAVTCPKGLAKDGSCQANITAFAAGSTQSASITVTPAGAAGTAQDVSQLISVIPSGFFRDHSSGLYLQQLEIINQTGSTVSIPGPIAFVPVSGDPSSTWTLVGGFDDSHQALTTGITKNATPKGQAYILLPLTGLPDPGHFNPGDVVFVTLSFSDPSNAFITYNSVFLANGSF